MIKTVSLELAKKMKELGFPQGSHKSFYYISGKKVERPGYTVVSSVIEYAPYPRDIYLTYIAAPTAEEVLEQLPAELHINSYVIPSPYTSEDLQEWQGNVDLRITKHKGVGVFYMVRYWDSHYKGSHRQFYEQDESLAEAAGKMWVYLKEQKLI